MPIVPDVKSCSDTFWPTSRMVPSVTMRPSVSMAVLPAGPSKATFFSSAVSIVPPLEKTRACHIQLPVMSQSKWKPWVEPPNALTLRAISKMPSHVAGSAEASPPAFVTRSVL